MTRLKRDFVAPVELRDGGGEMPDIVGLAAPFFNSSDAGTEFRLWTGAVERIMPSAFDSSLEDRDDIYASFNHNADNVMGRVGANTLKLEKTERGLEYSIKANEKSAFYRDLISRIERGDIGGSSITFSVRENGVEWVEADDDESPEVRELHSVRLYELGPVVSPAYKATETGVRDEWRAWRCAKKPVKRVMASNYLDSLMGKIVE